MEQLRNAEVERLSAVLAQVQDAEEMFALMQDLFTIREIKDMAQRLSVAELLDEGSSYSAIESQTGASATTIARVSKALNYGSGGYQRALEILSTLKPNPDDQASVDTLLE